MEGVFFKELGLPAAHHNLAIGSGTHTAQLAAILSGLEPILTAERPDVLLVEGDTNSVLGAALCAHKSGIRVGHVEAGLRSYDRGMPEEINRILTDHLSDHLFAPTDHSRDILLGEGIATGRIHVTGNTVVDELMLQRERANGAADPARFGIANGRYALATVHRAENVDDDRRLRGIFAGLSDAARALDLPVLAALHPRTTKRLAELKLDVNDAVRALPPLPYLEFLGLHARAALMLTDSGGLQEEACCLGVPCVTLRDNTERPESVEVGANVLAGADPVRIAACAREMSTRARSWSNPFGDGHSGERIVDLLIGSK
jgi:UDP-N-acetylglucosamine 2-epimerase (non-hydrolysing)